jgi:3-oxoadipate CoA-transferase alpha subunit
MGHGGFYSPIGINSIVAKGKEKRVINGREYVLEEPIRPDVGLIKAYKADKLGNLVYRGTGRGANPVIAMASKTTIAEVFQIVEVGELDPETIITPGIYVDRIVRIPDDDVTSEKRRGEFAERIRQLAAFRAAATSAPLGGQQ